MMTKTLDAFSRELLDDDAFRQSLEPESLAAAFVRFFDLSGRPGLEELNRLMSRAGFGQVSERHLDGLKGLHLGRPRGEYDIYYRRTCGTGPRPTRCSTRPTRSSTRPCAPCTPTPRRNGRCAKRPTGSRRRC